MRRTLEERFWSKVDKSADGCWLWTGARYDNRGGYGCFVEDARRASFHHRQSHRVAWELASNTRLIQSQVIGHVCDTPLCVRADDIGTYVVNGRTLLRRGHLFLGTAEDNRLDMIAKGRALGPRGERSGHAKLTSADVVTIRQRAANGELQRVIAAEFGITQSNVSYIVSRGSWAH